LENGPRISIVTPSFNQGKFIGETIKSVLGQNYSDVEHIVIDGASTDETLKVLSRYPHLRVISEPDSGQAEAINKGFRMATGDIWGFLNSDDTLMPNALISVVRAFARGQDPDVVMGRCRFVDEKGDYLGIEHPSHFKSHERVLAVWKGHFIPQPAVFWRKEVWDKCGGMDENLKSQWIDYDLFCRFSKWFKFHSINRVLATYRLHDHSKSEQSSEADRLLEAIQISRRYWGPVGSPKFLKLALSLCWFRFDRIGRARRFVALARESRRHHNRFGAFMGAFSAFVFAPEVAFYTSVYPAFKRKTLGVSRSALTRLRRRNGVDPRTAAYLEQHQVWEDNRVGPSLIMTRKCEKTVRSIQIKGSVDLSYIRRSFFLTVIVNGQELGRKKLKSDGDFSLKFEVPKQEESSAITVEIKASEWFVPHSFFKNGDFRPVSWRMGEITLNSK
jgi:glycosyltransferase involved in cell wall biosynthesis